MPGTAELNWEAESDSGPRQFSTIWWDIDKDAGDGKPRDDLYTDTDDGDDAAAGQNAVTDGKETVPVRDGFVVKLLDDDGDPMYGDIGKIDRRKKAPAAAQQRRIRPWVLTELRTTTRITTRHVPTTMAATAATPRWTIDEDYTFHSGTAFECEVDRTVAVECTWDAQGGLELRNIRHCPLPLHGSNLDSFLSCDGAGLARRFSFPADQVG